MNSRKKIVIFGALIVIIAVVFAVSNVKVPSRGSAKLSWNANTELDLSGYKIYYGTTPRTGDCPDGGYAQNIKVGKVTSYTLDNLEPGKTYYFSVTSYNQAGKESCFSAQMSKNVPETWLDKAKKLMKM